MRKARTKPAAVVTGPRRRLSLGRVAVAILVVAGAVYQSVSGWNSWQETQAIATQTPWYGAYVDVTSTPVFAFEQLRSAAAPKNVVLAFIVASPDEGCTPSWGGYYTPGEARVALDLDRRIARLQQQGGKVAISFGGALNRELALACEDPDRLLAAYQSVVEWYQIDTIDLDLENESLRDAGAAMRRAAAIAQLQRMRRQEGKSLAVWLTLPVSPQGLTPEGTNAIAQMLSGGVDLAGVNLMTMDYSSSKPEGMGMAEASVQALTESHRQLGILYQQAGTALSTKTLWRKIGATPMIGQNDVAGEVFFYEDALVLNQFGLDYGMGRMSMWSANRDVPCGDNYVDVQIVSDSCSGVTVEPFMFTNALSRGFDGDLAQNATIVTTQDAEVREPEADDPEKSPYQIWSETGAYIKGTKVVWYGNVYEAKWWTKNDMPNNPVLQSWETPWQLIGPVLPGETPVLRPTLPPGTYPNWSGTVVYDAGDRVLFEEIPFQAKWWNQSQSPAASAANADSSPWLALSDREIKEVLADLEQQPVRPTAPVKAVEPTPEAVEETAGDGV